MYLRILMAVVLLSCVGCLTFLCGPDAGQSVRLRVLIVPFLLVSFVGAAASFIFRDQERREALFATAVASMMLWMVADAVHMSFFTVDDAWISARYGHTLATRGSLNWNSVGPPVEGYSNFAWVMLATAVERFGFDPIVAFKCTGILFAMAALVLVAVSVKRRYGCMVGTVTAALLCFDPRWALHAVSGLETVPFAFLVLAATVVATSETRSHPWALALLGLVMGLTRPEGVLVFAVLICANLLYSTGRKRVIKAAVVAYAVPAMIYMAWRVAYFGAVFPNTFYAKVTRDTWNVWGISSFLESVPFICLAVVISAIIGFSRRERISVVVATALAVFYSRTNLVMNYSDRFFMPLLPLLVLSTPVFINWLWNTWRSSPVTDVWRHIAVGCIACSLVLSCVSDRRNANTLVHDYGTMMRSAHIPIGKVLSSVRGLRVAVGDAGAIAYYSRAECIDFLGLNDRAIAMMIRSGTLAAEMPPYVLAKTPDVIVLVSADASEVKPSTAGMQYYSYIIAADKAFRGYERLRTYTTSDPAYCVQVWARRASAHYAALNEALARQ